VVWITSSIFSADDNTMLLLRSDNQKAPSPDLRMFARTEQKMIAEAHRLDHSVIAHRQPRLRLAVRDLSVNGMSAISEQPVEKGEHVGVSFPADGGHRAWGAYGRVVRCEPSAMGYRLAVEFDPLPAA
jgi:hypothetical protein